MTQKECDTSNEATSVWSRATYFRSWYLQGSLYFRWRPHFYRFLSHPLISDQNEHVCVPDPQPMASQIVSLTVKVIGSVGMWQFRSYYYTLEHGLSQCGPRNSRIPSENFDDSSKFLRSPSQAIWSVTHIQLVSRSCLCTVRAFGRGGASDCIGRKWGDR
jgi:hypothetical protein